MNRLLLILCLGINGTLFGCTVNLADSQKTPPPALTPTIHPFFKEIEAIPTLSARPVETVGIVVPTAIGTTEAVFSFSDVITTTIYGDNLNPNWELLDTKGMEADILSTEHVFDGRYALSMTPTEDWSTLYFAVSEDTTEFYRQSEILGISFWLYSGDNFLPLEDLLFTVVGSNDKPYWVAGDRSVYIDEVYPFSETRLYFLGLNRSIPPQTWVLVDAWLDIMIYDPSYSYVTGFYIKNNEGFLDTVYIDEINLIMKSLPEPVPSAEPIVDVTPTQPILSTPSLTPTNQAISIQTVTPELSVTNSDNDCVVTPPANWVLFSIREGDTLSGLASQYDVTLEELMRTNCLSSNVLSINQQIWLPSAAPSNTAVP